MGRGGEGGRRKGRGQVGRSERGKERKGEVKRGMGNEGGRRGRGFFFFQAEDGIRVRLVTGVQTCALPIYSRTSSGLRPLNHALPALI